MFADCRPGSLFALFHGIPLLHVALREIESINVILIPVSSFLFINVRLVDYFIYLFYSFRVVNNLLDIVFSGLS